MVTSSLRRLIASAVFVALVGAVGYAQQSEMDQVKARQRISMSPAGSPQSKVSRRSV